MIVAEKEYKVEFYDCDPMGVVWNGKYFDYFEMARSELLSKMGLSYLGIYDKGYMLPLIRNKIKYIRSLKPGQVIIIKINIVEYEYLLKFSYEIYDKETNKIATKGESVQMVTDLKGAGIYKVPNFIIEAFEKYLNKVK